MTRAARRDGGTGPLVVLLGSGRRGGNGELLCREAAAGAAREGMRARLVRLSSVRMLPCAGCLRCAGGGGACRGRRDGAARVLAAMEGAGALLFSTPVYFWNVSGLVKTLFDRMLPLAGLRWTPGGARMESRLAGKPGGAIVVQEERERPGLPSIPRLFFTRNFEDFGIVPAGIVLAAGARNPGDVRRDAASMRAARELGARLAAAARHPRSS